MAIEPQVLNMQVEVAGKVGTGVYMNASRNTCVVVKVKDSTVHYLSFITGVVRLECVPLFVFARDWPIRLPNYPARRALRSYSRCGLAIEGTAGAVLRAVLAG